MGESSSGDGDFRLLTSGREEERLLFGIGRFEISKSEFGDLIRFGLLECGSGFVVPESSLVID